MDGLNMPGDALAGPDALASAAMKRLPGAGPAGRGLKAARDFEGILLHRVMEAMRRTVPDGGLLSSPETRQMESLFWMVLAEEVARQGGLGLGEEMARKLDLTGSERLAPPAKGPQA